MNATVRMVLRRKQTNKRKRAGRRERLRAGVKGSEGGYAAYLQTRFTFMVAPGPCLVLGRGSSRSGRGDVGGTSGAGLFQPGPKLPG